MDDAAVGAGVVDGAGLRITRLVGPAVVALSAVAAACGLLLGDLYHDPDVVVAAFRGNDVATLVVGVPLLVAGWIGARRGSLRWQLVWIGALGYTIYNVAYYVYGSGFNDLFLVHVVVLVLAVLAAAGAAAALDLGAVGRRLGPRPGGRWVGVVLLLLAVAMSSMYATAVVGFAVSGQQPADVLPMPPERVHLAYALDLTLLVPVLVWAAVELWRRTALGHVLGVAVSVAIGAYQLNYLAVRFAVASAGVVGVSPVDPRDFPVPLLLLALVVVLLVQLREVRIPAGERRRITPQRGGG